MSTNSHSTPDTDAAASTDTDTAATQDDTATPEAPRNTDADQAGGQAGNDTVTNTDTEGTDTGEDTDTDTEASTEASAETETEASLPDLPLTPSNGTRPLNPHLPHIIVYTQPGCMPCKVQLLRMKRFNLPALVVDISQDDLAHDYVVNTLRVTQTPVTLVHNVWDTTVWWSGFTPDAGRNQLNALILQWTQRMIELTDAGIIDNDDDLMDLPTTTPDDWVAAVNDQWPGDEGYQEIDPEEMDLLNEPAPNQVTHVDEVM